MVRCRPGVLYGGYSPSVRWHPDAAVAGVPGLSVRWQTGSGGGCCGALCPECRSSPRFGWSVAAWRFTAELLEATGDGVSVSAAYIVSWSCFAGPG